MSKDMIQKPSHYTWHPKIECKDVTTHFPYNLGTAIAYIWRCDHKGTPIDDLKKAIRHLEIEIESREND